MNSLTDSIDSIKKLFLQNEKFYVEELDRIASNDGLIGFIQAGNSDTDGWFLMLSNPGTADWNMARLIGNDIEQAKEALKLFPCFSECMLITHEKNLFFSEDLETAPNILMLEKTLLLENKGFEKTVREHNLKLSIKKRKEGIIDGCLQTAEGKLAAFVKTQRKTSNYIELAIEVAAEHRNKGFGTFILNYVSNECLKDGFLPLYLVEKNNPQSLRIAEKCGFTIFASLKRFIYKRNLF
ncbi:MAG: GNAT family N-acetyltransferase [Candidatus Riflebacteria bacterium]|nr:GNAT family N-acetyltransferase [Candidatus Riflebacteria bacterium]